MGMLLYVCPDCHRWQDASAMEYLGSLFTNLGNTLQGKQVPEQQQKEPLTVPCPKGCGLMTQVKVEQAP